MLPKSALQCEGAFLQYSDAFSVVGTDPCCNHSQIQFGESMIDHALYSFCGISSVAIIHRDCIFQFHIALIAIHIAQADEADQLALFAVNDRLKAAVLCPESNGFLGTLDGVEECHAASSERFIPAHLIQCQGIGFLPVS